MFDQAALVREACKWDYELRFPEQVAELFDRAWAIANSTPKGPVYLSLPREVLCERTPPKGLDTPSSMAPVVTAPEPQSLARAADLLAAAKSPLIISQRGTGSRGTFEAFGRFVDDWALPVSHYWANQLSLPLAHPMQIGEQPEELLAEADVVLVVNSLAPWWPDKVSLRDDVKVIHLGPDPLFTRTPVRNFNADVTLAGETAQALGMLMAAMEKLPRDAQAIAARRARIASLAETNRKAVIAEAEKGAGGPMSKEWVSLCVGRAIKGRKATIFHELGLPLGPLDLEDHNSFFKEPHSGGLGWGLPAALGAQLAERDRLVFLPRWAMAATCSPIRPRAI
ncbi:thiamine pyrophosphate-binding protein [Roseibium salinum]|nr:thiamine pyrophosphate-binding protein [Roseibium salinum]